LLKHGITSIVIENIGPFRERTSISLGRHNVVFGNDNSGESSLCESIAAFA
jgi:predicted ATPase